MEQEDRRIQAEQDQMNQLIGQVLNPGDEAEDDAAAGANNATPPIPDPNDLVGDDQNDSVHLF